MALFVLLVFAGTMLTFVSTLVFFSVLYLIYCISSNKHSALISALPRRSIHLLGHDTKLVPPPPHPLYFLLFLTEIIAVHGKPL